MAEFAVNTHRRQPYAAHRFRLRMDGAYVAGLSKVSGLVRTTEVVVHRKGGDPSVSVRSPGRTTYAPITLERGVTHDPAFEDWATLVHDFSAGHGAEIALAGYRKDLLLELANEAGQVAIVYRLYGCWPSTYEAMPELDANGRAQVAIQRLVLECEGWERDRDVSEPTELDG